MKDHLPDTPVAVVFRCPKCDPEPGCSLPVMDRFCDRHRPSHAGVDDELVPETYLSNTDAGGDDNRAFCDWLHRRKILLRGPG